MSLIDIHIQADDFAVQQNDYYDEMNVQLADDDVIESRCGEIFVSRHKVLIFACTECKENFCSYDDFFIHLCEQHLNIEEEEDIKYDPTEESTNEEPIDENLMVIMETEDSQDEHNDIKPIIEQNLEESSAEGCSNDLSQHFEAIDEYEALEESEIYRPEEYTDNFSIAILKENSTTTDKKTVSAGIKLKPKRTLLRISRSPSPVPDVFIAPIPSSTSLFKCTHCPQDFKLEFDLKNHLKLHETKRKFKCEICGFRFTLICNLRAHVRRHIGEKQYPCDECEKHFWTSTELNTHRRKHTGERPFICEFCGSAFKTSGALTDHEKRHTQKKRHKCSECERSFLHLQVLREHMNTHTLDRPFVCKVCKATFARKHSLTQHSSLHSAEKKYICEICSKDFAQLPGLLAHKRRHELEY